MANDFISRKDAKDKHCEICEHLNICYQYDGDDCRTYTGRTCIERQCFNTIPAADVVEIVRCRECMHWKKDIEYCDVWEHFISNREFFCACGKRSKCYEEGGGEDGN